MIRDIRRMRARNSSASFTWGKGLPSGTGTPRNAQSGPQPSLTS